MARGQKPQGKVRIEWSADFAYAIGLIASDGNLSSDGRHLSFVSKDLDQIENFLKCLDIEVKIGTTASGSGKRCFRVQFGDVLFYRFLNSIGLHPAKSKTMPALRIPREYFFHFLRGLFDGDGYTHSYHDKRWKSSFMFYLGFVSASSAFIAWLRAEIRLSLGCRGHVTSSKISSCFQLKYAKEESLKIIRAMYSGGGISLSRKKLKIKRMLAIVGQSW